MDQRDHQALNSVSTTPLLRVEPPMATDKELTIIAANAAGLELGDWNEEAKAWHYQFRSDLTDGHFWSPLDDDGDAMRLAVHNHISFSRRETDVVACVYWRDDIIADVVKIGEPIGSDVFAATRRAIVRCAVELYEWQLSSKAQPPTT